jgi:hypothetical protein
MSQVQVSVKMISVAQKLRKIEEQCKKKIICFGEDIAETKVINLKSVFGFESR